MVQLWIPKDELKADLQDQARKRLEEIEREAEKRRNQIMQASQDKLNDQRVQAAMTRFNDMVDPLLAKGGEALEGAASGIQDTSERARQMVEEAQRSIQNAPTLPGLDGFGLDGRAQQQAQPQPPETPPETPTPAPSALPQIPVREGVNDLMGGITGALNGLGTPTPPTPSIPSIPPAPESLPPEPGPEPMAPPAFPGGAPPPPPPPGFKPPGLPGAGLGNALAERIRGGMDAAGEGIGDRVTEGRDQAMELANKSLDIARDAMSRGGESFRQTPIARAAADAASFRPPGMDGTAPRRDPFQGVTDSLSGFREANAQGRGLGAIRDAARDAALPLFTGESAASQTAEAIAPWTPEMQRNQEAWEGYQGTEREGAGLGGLLSGAGAAARKYEQQTREQGETLLGKGTQGEGPLQQLQSGFGYAMAPYGALPEIARGGVEEATGSPLAGSAAYFATSVLGPGGIRGFLQEGLPTMSRMLTNPRIVPELLKNDPTGTLKAMALGAGIVGGAGYGGVSGIKGLKEGATPQEAAAQALTNAADILQISEAAGIPIDIGARVWRVLPKMPGMPSLPGTPARPEVPGLSPGELPPPPGREGSLSPEERPLPEEPPLSPEDGARGIDGVGITPRRPRTPMEIENAPGERLTPLPEEAPSRARQYQQEQETADAAVARAEARRGPLETVRRFGENLTGDQGNLGVLFGNAPRTMEVGGRQVGATSQVLNGAETLIPETDVDITGRRTAERGVGQSVDPATRQIRGSIEDRMARAYKERDLTAAEEEALGLGMPGQPGDKQGVAGLNRQIGFRHPGWVAKDYAPDPEAGVMRYMIPDKQRMAAEQPTWTPMLRTGKGKYEPIPTKKGASKADALEALSDVDENAPAAKKGTPVLLDTATNTEINIAKHPDMPWKEAQTPITVKEGMARDGTIEDVAKTPLSYHRLALVRGLGLRNFYPNFGQIFRDDLARKSPTMLRELNAIYGATASQASPETNLQRTLAVMAAGRYFKNKYGADALPTLNELSILTGSNWDNARHTPTDRVAKADLGMFPAGGITSADLNKALRIWETGRADIGAGWKTPVFFQNILTSAKNMFDWLSVPDTHMFRGRGYTMTGGSAPATVNQDLRALGITHATVAQLADEFGLNPKQVQSALWFDYKENLAPFNGPDKARIKAKAGGAEEGTPEWMEAARTHDPWPTTDIRSRPKLDAEGNPLLDEEGAPQYETARQGTIDSVMQHVSGVNPGEHAKLAADAALAPDEIPIRKRRGKDKINYDRFDLLKAFREQDAAFKTKYGRDALTPQAERAALTFNGRAVGDQATTGWQTEDLSATSLPAETGADTGAEGLGGMPKGRYPTPEITPEAMERAAFKGGQDAPVAVVPVDAGDGEALSRLGYDPQTKQIDTLLQESIPHEVILTNRPFTVGAPGLATPRDTIHVLFPGASLDTARYGASLLGERAGADEVAITWPTAPGRGRPVVSIDHPEGREWTQTEIDRYPWAQKLIGRANISPDGRTMYFADLGTDSGGVPFAERVGAILDDAMTPEEQQALVHRDESFGVTRVGADEFRDVVGRGTLAAGGPLGEAAMARAFPGLEGGTPTGRPFSAWGEGGEAVPGSRPGAVSGTALREYAGPERFRPEGAPVGSLGVRAGDGQPLRDTLDERLQIGQMVAGGLAGGAKGAQLNEQEDEQNPLKAGARVLGGGLLGATVGANAANPRRLFRAFQDARSFSGGVRSLAGDEAGRLGAVAKGGPTGDVPKRGELRGEAMGLGDLDDPENIARLLVDPPENLTGEQINEIGRAAFKRLKAGNTPEQRAQQVEAERSRRLVRRQEGIEKVDAAATPGEVADAAAEAADAAERGEIPHSDADAVRGRAARKLQQQKGEDGPPPPGEMDKQIAASRARRGADPSEPAPERDPGEGVTQPLKPPPAEVWRDMGDLTDEGVTVTETPEEVARRERLRQRALEEQEGADYEGGTAPGERAAVRPPAQDMARAEAQSVAPLPESEPPAPGRGPELDPYTRAGDLGQTPARVTSGSKAEAQQAEAARANARRYENVAGPITSPETEAAAKAVPTEPAERKIPRLVAPDGTLLTRAQAAAQLARDAARPGGWGAIRDEWNEGLSDAGKLLAAAGRGIKVGPKEMDEALAQVGGNGRGPVAGGPRVDGLSPRDRERMVKFRPEHVFDALGTMMRMNLVVTPEGFGRNLFSTTVALPLRFYEAATAPLFDRMWGVLPGQGDRGPDPAHSSEALAMAEGLYRSWAAGIANSMNVMRKGDTRLSEAQMGDASGAEADFRETAVGKAMGTFFRPMTATDAFLKTLNEGMEAYRLSHRQARNEFDAGLLGKDARSIRSRMIEIMSTPDQKFIDRVQQAGDYNTYNQKAGHIANMLEGWKSLPKGTPPAVQGAWRLMMNVLIPFVRISTNVMKFGLERTVPGGLISTAVGKGRGDRADRFAKMSEGALTLGGLWGMQQAGLIEVSGALPQDPDERDEWEMQGKTPFSMRVGDRWYDPRSIPGLYENVAMLGLMTDSKRKMDDKEARGEEVGAGDFLADIPNAIPQYLGQVGVRPAFGSVVDALGMMTASNDRDKDYHAGRLKRSLVGQLAPASGLMRQIGNVTDPYQRDAQTVPEMAAAAYPFFRENLPEKLDARGAPLPGEGYEFPLAGLTSSRANREDALLPREYLGSADAKMDAEIGSAIHAVQQYESDPRAHPRPTVAQRNLYYRFRSRKNPARQRANKAADRLDFQRKSAHADLAEDGLFEFRAPTGLLEAPDRLREMVGR